MAVDLPSGRPNRHVAHHFGKGRSSACWPSRDTHLCAAAGVVTCWPISERKAPPAVTLVIAASPLCGGSNHPQTRAFMFVGAPVRYQPEADPLPHRLAVTDPYDGTRGISRSIVTKKGTIYLLGRAEYVNDYPVERMACAAKVC